MLTRIVLAALAFALTTAGEAAPTTEAAPAIETVYKPAPRPDAGRLAFKPKPDFAAPAGRLAFKPQPDFAPPAGRLVFKPKPDFAALA